MLLGQLKSTPWFSNITVARCSFSWLTLLWFCRLTLYLFDACFGMFCIYRLYIYRWTPSFWGFLIHLLSVNHTSIIQLMSSQTITELKLLKHNSKISPYIQCTLISILFLDVLQLSVCNCISCASTCSLKKTFHVHLQNPTVFCINSKEFQKIKLKACVKI